MILEKLSSYEMCPVIFFSVPIALDSQKLGLSLGSVNYVLSHLVEAGLIRAKRFKNSKNKIAYMYILTPAGIKSKMQLSRAFLKRKLDEYEMLKMEIEELRREVGPDKSLSD